MPPSENAAIGIFDSGIGGLSILRHIRVQLPQENLLYFADSGFAPYGERSEAFVVERSLTIAHFLLQRGAKALVVACNTATAAAIQALRARYPALPLVGVEPGLKPASLMTSSRTVGVLATDRTLSSSKFNLLREQLTASTGVRFVTQACLGLADSIEKGDLHSRNTADLVLGYVTPLMAEGADTLVLGCTHYPFVQPLIEQAAKISTGKTVNIIDTGQPVTRQLIRLLVEHKLLQPGAHVDRTEGSLQAFTTGSEGALSSAFTRLLNWQAPVTYIPASSGTDIYG